MQDLLPIGAFAALLFIGFAVLQSVRERPRVDTWGTILAFVAVSVSILVLTLANDDAESSSRIAMIVLANAVIVLVVSLVILVLDWRRPTRDLDHSFGILGVGVSVLLIVGVFITPTLLTLVSGALPGESVALAGTLPDTGAFPMDTAAAVGNAAPETASAGNVDNSLPQLLMAETGLTMDELNAQLEAGSSLADLVAANGGNLDVVTAALTQAIETGIADGTIPEQMASRMGDDVAGMVEKAVNGEMPPQAVSLLFGPLLQSGAGTFPADGMPNPGGAPMNPPTGGEGAFPANANIPDTTQNTLLVEAVPTTEVPAAVIDEPTEAVTEEIVTEEATPVPVMVTDTPTLAPTVAPTVPPIVFEDTGVCQVAVNYLINLRTAPNIEAQVLTTIPYTAIVNAAGHNAAGWWQVTYEGMSGWVSGEYITPNAVCQSVPTLP